MKGLLVKDFRFTMQNGRILGILVMIEAVFLVMRGAGAGTAAFIMGYMTMGCGMLVLNTISMDEYDGSTAFLMAMPVSRRDYVLEKYVFLLICSLLGGVAALVPCCLLSPGETGMILVQAMEIWAAMLVLQMVMLPAQLKFGGDKGRMVLVGVFAAVVLVAAAVEKAGNRMEWVRLLLWRVADGIGEMDGLAMGTAFAVLCAACFLVSFAVSRGIMEKKEF